MRQSSAALSGPPVTIIDASKAALAFNARELWEYRDLFLVLVQRDLKLRYRQTFLGAIWAVLQPVLPMIVFTLLLGRLAHMPSDGLPYPIFVFAGLLPWTFFNNAVTNAMVSLVNSAGFITKVYFPRLLVPGACVFGALIDLGISGVILLGMMAYYHVHVTLNLLILPLLLLLVTMATFAVGIWTSALYVKYRDVRHALPFVLQVWMYLTPVIYPVTFIPLHFRWLLNINPLSGMIEGFRCAFFGQPLQWLRLGIATASTAALLLYAGFAFRHMERQMADIV
jgi:lipopolysaccharide transport system permease protein